jgi:hypothetical protein
MTFKVRIDASLFALDVASLGVLSGELELVEVPTAGNYISFGYPAFKIACTSRLCSALKLKVARVVHHPQDEIIENSITNLTTLYLEDVVFEDSTQGTEVCKYLEQGFGLYFDSDSDYDENLL